MHIRLLINCGGSEESQSNQKIKRIFFLIMRNISKVNDHHQLKKIPILNDCMFHIHFTLPHPYGINYLVNDDRLTDLIGPPACAKSLFMLDIEKYMSSKVY